MKKFTPLPFFWIIITCLQFSSLQAQQAPAVDSSNFEAFDFWVGEWVVYQYGTENIAGYSKIESILNGIAIRESYETANAAYKGTSLSKYNPATGNWEQYWVDNGGLTLHIIGKASADKMVLEDLKGNPFQRISWLAHEDGTVRQIWEQSSDEGKTWTRAFDGHYKQREVAKGE